MKWTTAVFSGLVVICAATDVAVRADHLDNSIASVFSDADGNELPYHFFLPSGHDEPGQEVPLVVFLHGAGERGNDNRLPVDFHIDGLIDATQGEQFSSFLLAPQVPSGSNWSAQRDLTFQLLDQIESTYAVDTNRIYVTGLSMGGFGTFDFIAQAPNRFAAAAPMSGGGDPGTVAAIRHVPTWIFHGADDLVVPVEFSRQMNDELLAVGGAPIYSELPNEGHGIWGPIYRDEGGFYPWMFKQRLSEFHVVRAPDSAYAVIDNDSDSMFDNQGDAVQDASGKLRRGLGELDSDTTNQTLRLITKFELPHIPDHKPILSQATLRIFVEAVDGTPSGPVSLFYSATDNDHDLLSTDYDDASYVDTLLDVVRPTDPGQQFYDVNVLDLILAEYAADGPDPRIAFRLQVDGDAFVEDDQSGRYLLTTPGSQNNHPQLVLTFVPEPAAARLVVVALAGLLVCGRRLGLRLAY